MDLFQKLSIIQINQKTKYNTDKSELKNKTLDTGLVKKTDYNTKITEIEGTIPEFSNKNCINYC